jgi:hypothetical protein
MAIADGENDSLMTGSRDGAASELTVEDLLRAGTEAEQKLLKQERKAEQRLNAALAAVAQDESRLAKARARLERSREAMASAEAELRAARARRAAGPPATQD